MTDINKEYYFAFRPDQDEIPILQADDNARLRKYRYEKLVNGAPLKFFNGFRDEFKEKGISEKIGKVLHDAPFFLVSTDIKNKLEKYDTFGLQLYPSIYIDNGGNYHEGYWFTNFYEPLPLLDWDLSVYEVIEGLDEDDNEYLYEKIVLNSSKITGIPEDQRLMMHESNTGYVLVHKRIAELLSVEAMGYVQFIKVNEFEDGDQYS